MPEGEEKPVVLMVDDEPDFLNVVRFWAEPDYEFVGLTDGADLIAEMEGLEPSLVVLDVMMPGEGGFDLCRRIRGDRRFKDVPILFLTGSRADEDFLRNMEVGGSAYLTKPVGRRQLLGMFRELTQGADELVDTPATD